MLYLCNSRKKAGVYKQSEKIIVDWVWPWLSMLRKINSKCIKIEIIICLQIKTFRRKKLEPWYGHYTTNVLSKFSQMTANFTFVTEIRWKNLSLLHAICNVFSRIDSNQLEIALQKCFILHLGASTQKIRM